MLLSQHHPKTVALGGAVWWTPPKAGLASMAPEICPGGGVRQRDGLWGRLGDPVWGPGGLGHSHLKSCGGRLPEVAAPGSRRVPAPREPVTPPWKCRVPEPPVASSSPFRVPLWGLQVWGSLLPPETSPPPPRPSPAVLPGWGLAVPAWTSLPWLRSTEQARTGFHGLPTRAVPEVAAAGLGPACRSRRSSARGLLQAARSPHTRGSQSPAPKPSASSLLSLRGGGAAPAGSQGSRSTKCRQGPDR